MKRHSSGQTSQSSFTQPEGRVVSHLKELLDANGLSVPKLASCLGVADLRPLYSLRNDAVRVFDFDLLARICALFDALPLETLLEYVSPGAEPETHYQKRTVLEALPCPFGGIRSLVLDHRTGTGTKRYFEQLASETGLHWSTVANLAYYRSQAVRSSTLATLCRRFGGVEQVFCYDPAFTWPA